MLLEPINQSLEQLTHLLEQLSDADFSKSCKALSNSTICEHTRHIIEMFQCLENSYDSGILNYDKRERNKRIQTETEFAKQCIIAIKLGLKKEDKTIFLTQIVDGHTLKIQTNYYRELLYNLEHCTHHQALMKVAVLQYENVSISENFGVARSTIEYKKECVQ
jgi:hypothetical protein